MPMCFGRQRPNGRRASQAGRRPRNPVPRPTSGGTRTDGTGLSANAEPDTCGAPYGLCAIPPSRTGLRGGHGWWPACWVARRRRPVPRWCVERSGDRAGVIDPNAISIADRSNSPCGVGQVIRQRVCARRCGSPLSARLRVSGPGSWRLSARGVGEVTAGRVAPVADDDG